MAKVKIPSINEIPKFLIKDKLLPVFFLSGEDFFSIDNALNQIKNFVEPLVYSEFDKEFINADKTQNINQILDLAYSFPFGGGKKLIVVKNFEKLDDKKELVKYINNSAEFSVIVFVNYGKISDATKEPYLSLLQKKFLFEASNETGEDLIEWIVKYSKKMNLVLEDDMARGLVEIVGEDKALIEKQLQKILDYSIDKPKLSFEEIKRIVSPTKQYSIFDLQEALGQGNKSKSVEIAFNLLDGGAEIVFIINMLAKFISTIAQITELVKLKINDNEGSKMIGVSWYYYVNCKKASFFSSDKRLLQAADALLNADLSVKTTNTDSKTVLLILISEMLKSD